MNRERRGSDGSGASDKSGEPAGQATLRPHGGYRNLRSFQVTEIISDGTVSFCARFLDARRTRLVDQMVQAARSGRQNIAEGSRASGTSSQTELRLVGVARASLDELLLDYEDYLRQHGLPLWSKDHPKARQVRGLAAASDGKPPDPTDRTDQTNGYARYRPFIEESDAETAANTLICLIHQANYLLDRQIAALEKQFVDEGGYSERLAAARLEARRKRATQSDESSPTDRTDRTEKSSHAPNCPLCGQPMALRTARKGPQTGSQFWGCAGYPACKATLAL
jgi:four helix bundle suffix protein